MVQTLRDLLMRFRRNESGNVLVFTAFAVPAIAIATVGAIDTWQMLDQHRHMKVAGEQAAIAALRPGRVSMRDRKELAERIFLINARQGKHMLQPQLKVRSWRRRDETFVQVTAKARYKSILGPVAGSEPKSLQTVTTAARKGAYTRIVSDTSRHVVVGKRKR